MTHRYNDLYDGEVQKLLDDIKASDSTLFTIVKSLDELKGRGVVTTSLEIRCPSCQSKLNPQYSNMQELPDEVKCNICGYQIKDMLKHTFVVYTMPKENNNV